MVPWRTCIVVLAVWGWRPGSAHSSCPWLLPMALSMVPLRACPKILPEAPRAPHQIPHQIHHQVLRPTRAPPKHPLNLAPPITTTSKVNNAPPNSSNTLPPPLTMAGLTDHLLSIPPVTRFFLIVTIAVSLGISLDIVSPATVMLGVAADTPPPPAPQWAPQGLSAKAQLVAWALRSVPRSYKMFTSFFVVDGVKDNGVLLLLNIYRFYMFSNYLEDSRGRFRGNFPDYLWFVLVSGGFLLAINGVLKHLGYYTLFYHSQLLSCMTFLWLRALMNSVINFLGIVPIKAYYLPLFDLGMATMLGKYHPADSFAGILAGYIYECVQSDTLPVYNLLPGAYGSRLGLPANGRRVGFNVDTALSPNTFTQAVFDLGYWKAPRFFYRLLQYPMDTSVRTTAFTKAPAAGSVPGSAHASARSSGATKQTFRGQGHRLGTL
ncbi:hypothetical protein METBIDRAFT_87254 [Metschnikowia bicuspidata var. bicuspidata NRRL YB-4993]|uniref:Derlin n=1 Tax=Metschnikowia bicuspidata var. bicuspidata NRRL YB-4993 TaxID=869754 RepID=A0A1A0HAS9_9ASCO|nr:hypothetical protein METBIDRAFT_87254 [Metschnikowia bicuspidata var. bicuspidata NRRL YB-4993]OBA20987.1 hypothetical protein METBIDRAFT_87254 [Metschnikowia bicuspidata var. bicuspidata NRRL YB-4993]